MSECTPDRIKLPVALWAVGGIALTFIHPIVRLGHRGWRAVECGLTGTQWLALIAATVCFAYFEGYRALQRRFVPDVVARSLDLSARSNVARSLLAPLYAASLLGSDRRAVVRAWIAVAAIVSCVVIVRAMPDPWRGIVDLAVAGALAWGLVALLAQFTDAVRIHTAAVADHTVANT